MIRLANLVIIIGFGLAACTATQNKPPMPFEAPPYVLKQLQFMHNAAVGIDTEAGDFKPPIILSALESTAQAYNDAKHLESGTAIGWIETYKPTIFLAANIDCSKAHDGANDCGGFISSDNAIHIKGHASGCIRNTSFVHFLLHYLVGCDKGAMDIEHTDNVFREVEPVLNLQLAQAYPACMPVTDAAPAH